MAEPADSLPYEVARNLEREMRIVREAIAVVAYGTSPRVIVAGLRMGAELLDDGRRLAAQARVRLLPLWHADGARVDIAIERTADERA